MKVGDTVKDGDTVVEISTDKVDMELPAPGRRHDHRDPHEEGETVGVGQVIAPHDRRRRRRRAGAPAPPPPTRAEPAPRRAAHRPRRTAAAVRQGRHPVAQRVAAALGVDLGAVAGSARGGRVTKADVLPRAGAATSPSCPRARTKIKGGGAALARYMDESRSIPTATSFRTLTVTALDARRKQLKAAERRRSPSRT